MGYTASASRLPAVAASLAVLGFSWRATGSGMVSKVLGVRSQGWIAASRFVRTARSDSGAGIATAAAMAREGARSERRMARNRFFAWFGLVWFGLKCCSVYSV
jgi:hypothetical protein